jgi:hypothetical protein
MIGAIGGYSMKKKDIITEKLSLADWAISLKSISDELWFKPFREGSWGIADVLAHFISWDRFIIENRVSYLFEHDQKHKA